MLDLSSSTFASTTVSSTLARVNDWLQATFGVDLYEVVAKVIDFVILIVRVTINILLEILPKIRDFLGSF
ncbi:MAG: hypothetical protein A2855_02350 [Candidatus Liptonbacteria bacterium RIFCSPHIGHO2_01_FULL_57_28]|uniref:Uncharacterized protein n=1 Tax=Candidatus Liptonbacteria bacterium RIFCSPHIGHO2_01_FULL_57_28 TaxID=1798647 RepID=A0A1G2C9A1_9BACT|nr:MAG: hypothetical protein A2855_02350 [Candidatus Liptonbacteria bacterium RIFCSPHIGHO2_01_FULL_57_28]